MKISKEWLDTHKWMLRTSDDGVTYGGYRRKRVGEWNDAADWTGTPTCDDCGGFFGIDTTANGFGVLSRRTMELCEWRGERVVIDGDKICVSSFRVVAVGADIPVDAFRHVGWRLCAGGEQIDSVRAGETVVCMGGEVFVESQSGGDILCYGGEVFVD
jgi:hypothetical protein